MPFLESLNLSWSDDLLWPIDWGRSDVILPLLTLLDPCNLQMNKTRLTSWKTRDQAEPKSSANYVWSKAKDTWKRPYRLSKAKTHHTFQLINLPAKPARPTPTQWLRAKSMLIVLNKQTKGKKSDTCTLRRKASEQKICFTSRFSTLSTWRRISFPLPGCGDSFLQSFIHSTDFFPQCKALC